MDVVDVVLDSKELVDSMAAFKVSPTLVQPCFAAAPAPLLHCGTSPLLRCGTSRLLRCGTSRLLHCGTSRLLRCGTDAVRHQPSV